MHKAVILLIKAKNKDNVSSLVSEFMEPYGEGDVWDWYTIGGRWNNELAPKKKSKQFEEWIHEEYKDVFQEFGGGYSINRLENDIDKPKIQAKWESLGLKGKNPYWDSYGFSLREEEEGYNIVPLSKCIETVREWKKDLNKEKEEIWEKLELARSEAKINPNKWDMSGYYAGIYKDLSYESFSFEINIYNVETSKAEDIPEDIKGYFAVIVDMHN